MKEGIDLKRARMGELLASSLAIYLKEGIDLKRARMETLRHTEYDWDR